MTARPPAWRREPGGILIRTDLLDRADAANLSSAAGCLWLMALAWTGHHHCGDRLPKRALLGPVLARCASATWELLRVGWWIDEGTHFVLVHGDEDDSPGAAA